MKKILLATTVLAAGAGVAAADVTLDGNARMGVVYDGTDMNFSSRVRANFNLSGTTDGGLEFGGSFGAHDAGPAASGTAGSVYVSGAFGKLSMGNVAGAAEMAVGDLAGVGYVGIGGYTDTIFITGDGVEAGFGEPIALYEYSTGDLSFYASTADGSIGTANYHAYSLGVAYSAGDYNFGLGYENGGLDLTSIGGAGSADASHVVASVGATMGSVAVKAVYGQASLKAAGVDIGDLSQVGLSAVYTVDALSVTGFGKQYKVSPTVGTSFKSTAFGVGVAYDLGGGAAVKGMVASVKDGILGANTSDTVADLGLTFSF